MMESRLDAMRRFWWQSSGSVDLDHAVLASPRNDLCRCSINGLQKQCTTPCPRSSSVIGGGRGAHDSAGTTRPARRGPSRRRVRTASAVLKNLVRQPEKTFSTVSANGGLILAPIADAGVSAAVRSTAHRPAVAGFQKRNRNPAVGSMLLCWRKPKPNPPCTWLNIMPK